MTGGDRSWAGRPLVSGSRIVNSATGSPGTLGFIGIGPNGYHYLVSCYHVLGRLRGSSDAPINGEEVRRSNTAFGDEAVALTALDSMHARLDIAAARLLSGVSVSGNILKLGGIKGMAMPVPGMRVLKFGAETGLTEGRIVSVEDTLIEIERPIDGDDECKLCDHGDSGALWVNPEGEAVGMHFQGSDGTRAYARPMGVVLSTLGLTLLTSAER